MRVKPKLKKDIKKKDKFMPARKKTEGTAIWTGEKNSESRSRQNLAYVGR